MENLQKAYSFRYVGTIEFDDLTSKVPLFESLDAYSDAQKSSYQKYVQEFESGVRFFEKGSYDKAKEFFSLCVKKDQANNLARYYLTKTISEMSKLLPNNL